MFRCTCCHQPKPSDQFRPKHKQCRDCLKAKTIAWQKANPEKVNAKSNRWKKTHREAVQRYQARWRIEHAKQRSQGTQAWKRLNPDRVKEHEVRRRARKRGGGGPGLTRKEWAQILLKFGYKCAYCKVIYG